MLEVNLWWANSRGCWDQGQILAMLNGDLWPVPLQWCEYQATPPPTDHGAVVVASGIMLDRNPEQCAMIKEVVAKLPWCILIHTGDEGWEFDSHVFERPKLKLWMMHPIPDTPQWGHRQLLLGWPWPSRQSLRSMALLPLAERRLDWCFAGHACDHKGRSTLVSRLVEMAGGEVHVSGGFAQGLAQPDYLKLLTETRIVPCPSGHFTPESFRVYEAIEAGCLPVTDRAPPTYRLHVTDFWNRLLNGAPWPQVETWDDFPALVDQLTSDPAALQRAANKVGAWWIGRKRQTVVDLCDDIAELSGVSLA